MRTDTLSSIPDPTNLVLAAPLPLTMHPASVYLASLGEGSRRTMREALDAIASLLTGGICNATTLNWAALRYQHTAAVRSVLMEKYSPATANKMLCALRRTLLMARRLGLMTSEDYDRAIDLESVRGEKLLRGRALTDEEVAALMKACTFDLSLVGIRDAAMLAILIVGLRRSEVVNLDLKDFNPRARSLLIRGAKGRKDRIVYLPVGSVKAVKDWLAVRGNEPGPLLHPFDKAGRIIKRRISEQAVTKALQKRGFQAKVAHFSPHDLRRTFISNLLDAGVDLATAASLAGHSSTDVTARYDRRGEAAKKRAIDLLNVPY